MPLSGVDAYHVDHMSSQFISNIFAFRLSLHIFVFVFSVFVLVLLVFVLVLLVLAETWDRWQYTGGKVSVGAKGELNYCLYLY